MDIKIREIEDGRFEAQYINERDRFLNGISQFGKSVFEAKINLQALINAIHGEQMKTKINILISKEGMCQNKR